MKMTDFPSFEDGPQGGGWSPAKPVCGGGPGRGCTDQARRAIKFSVQTSDGVTHRFLMTREGAAWLTWTMVETLSPRLARPMAWWYRRQRRMSAQLEISSGTPCREGSLPAGQALAQRIYPWAWSTKETAGE